jgi:hypothetical protein
MFGADEEAERVAQTADELAFLRIYRELDDPAQASVLRLMTAMPRARPPPRPTPGGNVAKNAECEEPRKVVLLAGAGMSLRRE